MSPSQSEKVYKGYFTLEVVKDGQHTREILRGPDSVSILLFDSARDEVMLVQQQRLAVVEKLSPGILTEVVAGRLDKGQNDPCIVAVQEALEEAGVTLAAEQIILVTGDCPLALSPGVLDEVTYLAYAEIGEGDRVAGNVFGNKAEGERTTLVRIPVSKLENYTSSDLKTFALIQWFLRKRMLEARTA